MDIDPRLKLHVDLLARAFPGRLALPLKTACNAIGIMPKTYRNRRLQGVAPFPARRVGGNGKLVVLIEDVARAALDLQKLPADALPHQLAAGQNLGGVRRGAGRPTRQEQAEASRQGLTVKELRARRAGDAA